MPRSGARASARFNVRKLQLSRKIQAHLYSTPRTQYSISPICPMLPLRDNIRSSRFPVITLSLVLINVLVFFWEASLSQRLGDALLQLAILPARYTDAEIARLFNPAEQIVPFFASMFLHGGWIHLIGNM